MKTFQIVTLFALVAASMAFSPNQAGKFKLRRSERQDANFVSNLLRDEPKTRASL